MIVEQAGCDDCKFTITGIAGHRGFAAITIEKDMMNSELGFGRKVLEVLKTTTYPLSICPQESIP